MHAESSVTKNFAQLGLFLLVLFLLGGPVVVYADTPEQPAAKASKDNSADELFRTIAALDAEVFASYNRCDMEKFASYFIENLEFYHDKGGVMWTRQDVVDATRKNICGKVRRELVKAALAVYPIKDFGAIETGEHLFCKLDTGKCEGIGKFAMIWQNKDDRWQITRVISYDHRPVAVSLEPTLGGCEHDSSHCRATMAAANARFMAPRSSWAAHRPPQNPP
jgi:hypothetical protein